MADIKPGPDTAEPDLPPSYDETNAAPAPLPPRSKPPPQQPLLRPPLPLEIPALAALRGKRIILASASPRRKQLLAQVRVPFFKFLYYRSPPPRAPPAHISPPLSLYFIPPPTPIVQNTRIKSKSNSPPQKKKNQKKNPPWFFLLKNIPLTKTYYFRSVSPISKRSPALYPKTFPNHYPHSNTSSARQGVNVYMSTLKKSTTQSWANQPWSYPQTL